MQAIDWGRPEPAAPILAPSSATPNAPDWLCITGPRYRSLELAAGGGRRQPSPAELAARAARAAIQAERREWVAARKAAAEEARLAGERANQAAREARKLAFCAPGSEIPMRDEGYASAEVAVLLGRSLQSVMFHISRGNLVPTIRGRGRFGHRFSPQAIAEFREFLTGSGQVPVVALSKELEVPGPQIHRWTKALGITVHVRGHVGYVTPEDADRIRERAASSRRKKNNLQEAV